MEIQKELRFKSGIYYIKCKANNRLYIGSSKDIYNRLHQHLHKLKNNKHFKIIQSSYNKYGFEFFECGVIEFCKEDRLLEREQYNIDTLKPYFNTNKVINRGYSRVFTDEDKALTRQTVKKAFESKNHFYSIVQSQKKPVYVHNLDTKEVTIFGSRAECIRFYSQYGITEKMIRNSIKNGILRNNLYFTYDKSCSSH